LEKLYEYEYSLINSVISSHKEPFLEWINTNYNYSTNFNKLFEASINKLITSNELPKGGKRKSRKQRKQSRKQRKQCKQSRKQRK
jgi:hypothetical protein